MNKKEAAQYLKISVRTLERYTTQGKIGVSYERGKTNQTAVYDQAELEKFKEELESQLLPARPAVAPPSTAEPSTTLQHTQGNNAFTVAKFIDAVRAAVADQPRAALPSELVHKPMLTVAEAEVLFGISAYKLKKAISENKLTAYPDGHKGTWLIKRADLDAYIKKL